LIEEDAFADNVEADFLGNAFRRRSSGIVLDRVHLPVPYRLRSK
jgi:hypothetical protein